MLAQGVLPEDCPAYRSSLFLATCRAWQGPTDALHANRIVPCSVRLLRPPVWENALKRHGGGYSLGIPPLRARGSDQYHAQGHRKRHHADWLPPSSRNPPKNCPQTPP